MFKDCDKMRRDEVPVIKRVMKSYLYVNMYQK